jgi:hypothetical protein
VPSKFKLTTFSKSDDLGLDFTETRAPKSDSLKGRVPKTFNFDVRYEKEINVLASE